MINVVYLLEIVLLAIVIALFAAWIILLLGKTGLRERGQVKAPKLIAEMLSCDFCLSWWTCLLTSIVVAVVTGELLPIPCALAATPITRYIIY